MKKIINSFPYLILLIDTKLAVINVRSIFHKLLSYLTYIVQFEVPLDLKGLKIAAGRMV